MTGMSKQAELAVQILEQAGYEAYIVGGCVRDMLLGKTPADWDITTSAVPSEVMNAFKDYRSIPTGLKHGTVTVLLDNVPVEITTFRQEGKYQDGRRPDRVSFVRSLYEDLSRRDFTVNAMAYNRAKGLIDYYGGEEDLKAGVIKCVGEPAKRFNEDGLRIMRALRFASVYDFDIEKRTGEAVRKCAGNLEKVSAERKSAEINKLLMGAGLEKVVHGWGNVLWEVIGIAPPADVRIKAACEAAKILEVRLALLFDNGYEAREALKRLKYDNKTINTVSLIADKLGQTETERANIRRMLGAMGQRYFVLLEARHALERASGGYLYADISRQIAEDIIKRGECVSLKQLAIDGRILMTLTSGKKLGEVLKTLLNEVIEDRLKNETGALMDRAKELLQKGN